VFDLEQKSSFIFWSKQFR